MATTLSSSGTCTRQGGYIREALFQRFLLLGAWYFITEIFQKLIPKEHKHRLNYSLLEYK
jgi:hypothetical protein